MGRQITKPVPWTHRMFDIKPILDEDGKPLREPPLNKEGFWKKPENPVIRKLSEKLYGKRPTTKR